MEFYIIKRKSTVDKVTDNKLDIQELKLYPRVSAKSIRSKSLIEMFGSGIISDDKIIPRDAPIADYFICIEPFGNEEEEFDWILLDAFYFDYDAKESPIDIHGWLVSKKFKDVLEAGKFKLGTEHIFHEAVLKYQNQFLEYYIFQFVTPGKEVIDLNKIQLVNKQDNKPKQRIPQNEVQKFVRNLKFTDPKPEEYIEYTFNTKFDLFFNYFHMDWLISKELKEAIQINQIKGFKIDSLETSRIRLEYD